jgi:hypothetical protein
MLVETIVRGQRADVIASAPSALALILLVGGPVAYAAAVIVGWPAYRFVRGTAFWRAPLVVALGGVAGAAVAFLLAPSLRGELFSIRLGVWRGMLLGATSAAVWWRLLHRGRSALRP